METGVISVMEKSRPSSPFAKASLKRATYDRFNALAKSEGKTLAGFLDDVSLLLSGNGRNVELIPQTPQQQVMGQLAGLRKEQREDFQKIMDYLQSLSRPQMPLFDQYLIQEALKSDPNVKRVGWYDLQDDGTWVFDTPGFKFWQQGDNAKKDREYETRRAADLKRIEKENKGRKNERK